MGSGVSHSPQLLSTIHVMGLPSQCLKLHLLTEELPGYSMAVCVAPLVLMHECERVSVRKRCGWRMGCVCVCLFVSAKVQQARPLRKILSRDEKQGIYRGEGIKSAD